MDLFTRLLNLVAFLESASTPRSIDEISRELGEYGEGESARRKFERDKKELISLGVPVEYRETPGEYDQGGYLISPGESSVADPGFTPPELAALHFAASALAMRDEGSDSLADAADGLRKFGGLGPARQAPTVAELRLDANLAAVFEAILQTQPLGFRYKGTNRQVVPWQVVHRTGNWYLVCFDVDAGEQRTYRMDRFESRVLPMASERTQAALEEARHGGAGVDQLRFRPWEFGDEEPVEVLVRLDGPAAAIALLDDPALDVAERLEDDAMVLRLRVRNPEGLWNWLLSFLDRAELLEPDGWRDRFVAVLESLAAEGPQERP